MGELIKTRVSARCWIVTVHQVMMIRMKLVRRRKRKVAAVLILMMKIPKEVRRKEDPLPAPAVEPLLRKPRSLTKTRKERLWLLTCLIQMLLTNQMQRSLDLNSLAQQAPLALLLALRLLLKKL